MDRHTDQGHGRVQWRHRGHCRAALSNEGRRPHRRHAVAQALHGGNARCLQPRRLSCRHELGEAADDGAAAAAPSAGRDERVERLVPADRPIAFVEGKVKHQQRQIDGRFHEAGEAVGERRHVAPDVGVVVERIAERHLRPERGMQPGLGDVAEWRVHQTGRLAQIGHERSLAARAAERTHAPAGECPPGVQQLQRLEQLGQVVHLRDAEAIEQRRIERGRSRERARVAGRELSSECRVAGLQGDQRHTARECSLRRGGKGGNVAQAFDVQADGTDSRVAAERIDEVMEVGAGGIAECGHASERQMPTLHGEVERDVAALGEHRHAAAVDRKTLTAMAVGPQSSSVEVVEQTVAVGPEEGHAAGGVEQLTLQIGTRFADLGESRGVADGAARATRRQVGNECDRRLGTHRNETRIRGDRQLGRAAHAAHALDRLATWVDGVELAIEADALALAQHFGSFETTRHRDRTRAQQPLQTRALSVGRQCILRTHTRLACPGRRCP